MPKSGPQRRICHLTSQILPLLRAPGVSAVPNSLECGPSPRSVICGHFLPLAAEGRIATDHPFIIFSAMPTSSLTWSMLVWKAAFSSAES